MTDASYADFLAQFSVDTLTGEGWTLCAEGRCAMIGSRAADPAVVTACGDHGQ